MLVGLDVGGTKILGVVLAEDGEVIAQERRDTPDSSGQPASLVASMAEIVGELCAQVGGSQVGGSQGGGLRVGVGMPGLVDRSGRLHFAPNLAGLRDLDLPVKLAEATDAACVRVDNDATCATRAEHAFGAARGISHALVVTLGTGIGGGLVLGGRVMRGARGFAGEVGHMVVEAGGRQCVCGQQGCWEQYASGNALGRMAREAVERGIGAGWVELAGGSVSELRGEHVTRAAGAGDPEATALLGEFGDWFAIGLANLVDILDVECCVIGGGLISSGQTLLGPIRRSFSARILGADHRPGVAIVPASLGEGAGAIGAALLVAEEH